MVALSPAEIAGGLSLAAWLYLAFAHGGFWRTGPLLRRCPAGPGKRVVAVIPARDEALTIAEAVRSLRQQTEAVIVVDDHSSDGTGRLARDAGAEVVQARSLPPGWTGKLWAVHQGVERAQAWNPDFLLFTDADIAHGPASVQSLVDRAEAEKRDLVSYMVRLRCETLAERLTIPAFVFFFFMLYPPAWVADPRRRMAGAAGGCVLIRPEALRRAGGVEAYRAALIDDCALAAAVKGSGGSLWLGLVEDTESLREYPEFRDIRHMVARTAFTQLNYSTLLLLGTALGMVFLYLLPVALALSGASIAAAAAWLVMACIFAPIARFYRQPVWMGLLLPGIAAFYLLATIESAVRYWSGYGGAWKGRNQAIAARGGSAAVSGGGQE